MYAHRKFILFLGSCLSLLFLAGCGPSAHYWGSLLGPGAYETNAWMARGKWNRCADGDYHGRHINSFSETKTCVENPAGGKICTFYYYYSTNTAEWRTWYQDKYSLYVNDAGIVTRCRGEKYTLGNEAK